MKITELLEAQITPYSRMTLDHATLHDITRILEKNCPNALQTMKLAPLWRGTRSNTADILKLDPSSGLRRSENVTNQYTLLMDNSPYMQGWPKRSKSFICSTSSKGSSSYGTVYAIFPCGNAKIAVCPGQDLWDTDIDIGDLSALSRWTNEKIEWDQISRILEKLGFVNLSSFEKMQQYALSEDFKEQLLSRGISVAPEDFIPYLQEKMRPEHAGFDLTSVRQWDIAEYPNNEAWFSAPCIAIRQETYNEWISYYMNR